MLCLVDYSLNGVRGSGYGHVSSELRVEDRVLVLGWGVGLVKARSTARIRWECVLYW